VRNIRGHEIVIGALLATAFWASIYVLTSNAASHYEICETAKEGTKECASYNIVGLALRKIGTSLDILSALITAIATILIARFTFTLKRSTDSLWEAGERQRLLSEDTAKRQLRAYVTVNGVMRTKDPGDLNGQGFAVLVDVKNSGQTPAYDFLQWARIEIREFPLVNRLPIHCLENPTRGILPPETKNLAFPTFTRALTVFEENAILANHTAVYVYGELDYLDVFGGRHLTRFRFRCNGQGYGLGMFKADGEGNEAT
jgi:hypothetical protein